MVIMTQSPQDGSPKSSGKTKVVTGTELKCLLERCKESIDACVHALPEGALKKEAECLLVDTQVVLDSEIQRVTIIVGEVLGDKAVDIIIPEWHPNELVILPFKKIPKELHSSLVKGLKLHANININADCAKDLVFQDFSLVM